MANIRMNLASLQQRDPYITDIVDTASQVALYSFNKESNKWERTSTVGSLFIYKRSASPNNGFMILNQLNFNSFIEPITKDIEFQQQDPFLLYTNSKSIFGIWFYSKDECTRIGAKLQSYIEKIMEGQGMDKSPSSGVAGAGVAVSLAGATGNIARPVSPSQVDIMQMLSKAQLEYDTGTKKSEPKPMIDNPNAAAIKTTSIIKPLPLKIPDSDNPPPDEGTSATPGTGVISLDALFRTASLQQGTITQNKPPNTSQPATQIEGFFSERPSIQRSLSTSSTTKVSVDSKPVTDPDDLPPLLKHIMSTGSMVEDIERNQRDVGGTTGDGAGAIGDDKPPTLASGLPDLTQPPPNHPAYRGTSPHAYKHPQQATSASQFLLEDTVVPDKPRTPERLELEQTDTGQTKLSQKAVATAGLPVPPQIVSGNLLPKFSSSSIISSQTSNVASNNLPSAQLPETVSTLPTSRLSPHASDSDLGAVGKMDIVPVMKTGHLLRPEDLLSSSSSLASSVNTREQVGSRLSTLAAAAASSTELLSPMAFITSTARKTPITHSQERSSLVLGESSQDTDSLPVAALTKQQLLQAVSYLLKNDPSFISTIHEAYLKSLHELSSQKS